MTFEQEALNLLRIFYKDGETYITDVNEEDQTLYYMDNSGYYCYIKGNDNGTLTWGRF